MTGTSPSPPAPTPSASTSRPQSITVFCGSSPGKDPIYLEAAAQLATELARNQVTLI